MHTRERIGCLSLTAYVLFGGILGFFYGVVAPAECSGGPLMICLPSWPFTAIVGALGGGAFDVLRQVIDILTRARFSTVGTFLITVGVIGGLYLILVQAQAFDRTRQLQQDQVRNEQLQAEHARALRTLQQTFRLLSCSDQVLPSPADSRFHDLVLTVPVETTHLTTYLFYITSPESGIYLYATHSISREQTVASFAIPTVIKTYEGAVLTRDFAARFSRPGPYHFRIAAVGWINSDNTRFTVDTRLTSPTKPPQVPSIECTTQAYSIDALQIPNELRPRPLP